MVGGGGPKSFSRTDPTVFHRFLAWFCALQLFKFEALKPGLLQKPEFYDSGVSFISVLNKMNFEVEA